jgi:hypothetical protein
MKRRICAATFALLLCSIPTAFAQDDTPGEQLGGYDSSASAVALSFQPFLPALVSTGDVPFEASVAMSTSRVKSGGNAFARGALLWPGATAADMGPVLGVAFGQPEIGSLIPKWPVQAEATQDEGEVTTGAPPVAFMRALGQKDRSEGDSRIADIHIPRIVHIEHIASTSSSVVTDSSVASEAIVKLQGVTLLAGFIKAEEIRSISRTSSIGSAASSSGDVDILGLTIGGVEVSVTDEGFQVEGLPPDAQSFPGAGGEPAPGTSPEEVVNQVLGALGARITMFNSISKVSGSVAQSMQPGVTISVENPAGGQGPIPPGRFDIFLAASQASALSTQPFSLDTSGGLEPGADDVPGGDTTGGGGEVIDSLGDGPEVAGSSVDNVDGELSDVAEGSLGAVPNLDDTVQQRDDYRFDGLPLGLVLGLILASVLVARSIRNIFNGLITERKGVTGE